MNRSFKVAGLAAAAATLAWAGQAARAESFVLAEGGAARCAIVLGTNATVIERHAADELAHFLGRVTGAGVEQGTAAADGRYPIWIATPDSRPDLDAAAREALRGLPDEGYVLRADARGLLIAGPTPLGALFGVYGFLEDHVGLRWVFPGPDGEVCPRQATLSVAELADRQAPGFERRTMAFGGAAVTSHMPDTWNWILRNRMRFGAGKHVYRMHRAEFEKRGVYTTLGGHVLMDFVPDSLFEEHPEYFALIDGERRQQGNHERQPCTTHPAVVDRIGAGVLAGFREEPAGGSYRFLNNDGNGWCECGRCRALDPAGEAVRTGGQVTTRFYTLKNEITRRVREAGVPGEIWGYAYQQYRLPPLGIRPDPALWVVLCDHGRCYRHALDDETCEPNRWFRDMYDGWAPFGNPLSSFTYYNCFTGGIIAAPLEDVVAADLRFQHRLGFREWHLRTVPPDGRYEHLEKKGPASVERAREFWRATMAMHYLQAKLAWDPDRDPESVLRDMDERFYGPAGGAMHRFRALLRKRYRETPGHYLYGSPGTLLGKSLVAPGAVAELTALLDEAAAAAGTGTPEARRVAKDRELFVKTWLAQHDAFRSLPNDDIAAVRRQGAIVLDGVLDEPDWRGGERVTGFRRSDGQPAKAQTVVNLLYDEDALYLGVELDEPQLDKVTARAEGRDDARIWGDDTLEVFVDAEGLGVRYAHLVFNAAGAYRDSMRGLGQPTAGDTAFDSQIEFQARIGEARWTVEARLPAKALFGTVQDGGRWRMTVARVRRAGGEPEVSTWMDGSLHNLESFRAVSFGKPIVSNGRFEDLRTLNTAERLARCGMAYHYP